MLSARMMALGRTVPLRLALAALLLSLHLVAATWMARERFGVPFNASPGAAPAFVDPARDAAPARWNRLAVSRWDSAHYLGLAARGYSPCPRRDLRGVDLRPIAVTCDFRFYPGYPVLGHLTSLGGWIPIDYALLGVSLIASFVFLFLWTGPAIAGPLGMRACLLSLVAFNAFPSSFALVTIQTEPTTLALTLGSFVALSRRRLLLGGLLAGAATAIRASGLATAAAFALAVVLTVRREPPRGTRGWAEAIAAVALCGWGLAAMMGVHLWLFHDPLLIVHAYSQALGSPEVSSILPPNPDLVARALDLPLHEGVWVVVVLLWLALGHREAMRGFSPPARAYFGVLGALVIALSLYGSANVRFVSMNRYVLVALPIFFAMGAVTRRRPLALGVWLVACLWHYWQADLCFFVGGPGPGTLKACHAAHWIGQL
jgi:hypothetical protein